MSELLSQERFGGEDLWIVTTKPEEPGRTGEVNVDRLGSELAAATTELAGRGGGSLFWWVTAPSAGHALAAEQAGFEPHRRLHRMERPLPVTDEPYTLGWRPFRPGLDDTEWLEVNRLSFAAHPNQAKMSEEDLEQAKAEAWFNPDGFLLSFADDQMSGFCWTKIHPDDHNPIGEIYVIGAHPNHHGRGLGRSLVLAGLDWLADQSVKTAMLYVEADNEAAVRLYLRLGFEVVHDFRAWSRVVAPV